MIEVPAIEQLQTITFQAAGESRCKIDEIDVKNGRWSPVVISRIMCTCDYSFRAPSDVRLQKRGVFSSAKDSCCWGIPRSRLLERVPRLAPPNLSCPQSPNSPRNQRTGGELVNFTSSSVYWPKQNLNCHPHTRREVLMVMSCWSLSVVRSVSQLLVS